MRFAILLACGALLLPVTSRAEWLEASSAHFVVYADDSEKDIQAFSQQLERFHSAISYVTAMKFEPPSPSNRVTVYVVRSESEVRKLYGGSDENLAAFYIPNPGRSLAIVPRIRTGTRNLDFSMIALLHEYAHHYMFHASTFAMPRWYSEGGAEFFASASFYPDGSVGIGQPANHRGWELSQERDLHIDEVLDPAPVRKRRGADDAFYGKSWLLFHYLTFSTERRGQLAQYIRLLAQQGKGSKDAAGEAFGDLRQLEKELNAYRRRSSLTAFKLKPSLIETGQITVRRLRVGEAAAMPVQIRSKRGVDAERAREILRDARALIALHPEDPAVLSVLAEAEHDAGNNAEAIAAADAAISRDPAMVNPYVQKGLSLFSLAETDPDPAKAFVRARAPFIALNKIEPDHPLPLIYNYLSFSQQQKKPTDNALNGLRRAVELAPFDAGLRLMLAQDLVIRQQFPEARDNLQTVAYNPHGGDVAAAAQRVLDRLAAQPDWDGQDVAAVLTADEPDEPEPPAVAPVRTNPP